MSMSTPSTLFADLIASSMTVSVRRPRKSIFTKTHLLDHAHVELRHDFIAVRAVERDVVRDRLGRDDDAGGVHAGVAREPFELLADLDDLRALPRRS